MIVATPGASRDEAGELRLIFRRRKRARERNEHVASEARATMVAPRQDPLLVVVAAFSGRLLVIGAATAAVVYALVKLRLVVLPVIVALFLSTLLAPPAKWLARRGWPGLVATLTVLAAGVGIIAGLFFLLAPQVTSELGTLSSGLRAGSQQALNWLVDGPLNLTQSQVDRYIDRAAQQLQESSALTSGVLAGAIKIGEVIAGLLLTVVLVFFFVKDGEAMFGWTTSRFPEPARAHLTEAGQRVWTTLGAYVRGTALVALVDGVLIAVALLLIGVNLVVPLAVLTFFGGFFPLVGAVVAGAVAALVALVTNGPLDALLVAGSITVIQQVEGDVLQPLVLGRAVKLHPVVILLALTAGAVLAGIAGAFLAVPITATATVIGSYVKTERAKSLRPISSGATAP
ncbi:MAG: AI-2E family transporter [Actinobacteria bacterium]|nr:AI-2E family transporter [Actinomycetota bacterium]